MLLFSVAFCYQLEVKILEDSKKVQSSESSLWREF